MQRWRYLPDVGLDAVPVILRVSALAAPSRPTRSPRLLPVPPRPAPVAPKLVPRRPRRPLEHRHARRALLPRKPFTDIAYALFAAASELSDIYAEFIRHGLRAKAPDARRHRRPGALAPPCSAQPVSYPTHALPQNARAREGSCDAAHVTFPVHAVVLGAHCAKLRPPCARALRAWRARRSSPHAFAILHTFTYTPRLAPALAALLPLPPAFLSSASSHGRSGEELTHATLLATLASPPALHALALHLCASSSSNLTR
ncbi:hypothetical protein DFH09DRAFT_1459423 [Mycena vulgaris]|nr:hypothetical protein DFH09DRAFT_1459423 [Mycena vulgaris]